MLPHNNLDVKKASLGKTLGRKTRIILEILFCCRVILPKKMIKAKKIRPNVGSSRKSELCKSIFLWIVVLSLAFFGWRFFFVTLPFRVKKLVGFETTQVDIEVEPVGEVFIEPGEPPIEPLVDDDERVAEDVIGNRGKPRNMRFNKDIGDASKRGDRKRKWPLEEEEGEEGDDELPRLSEDPPSVPELLDENLKRGPPPSRADRKAKRANRGRENVHEAAQAIIEEEIGEDNDDRREVLDGYIRGSESWNSRVAEFQENEEKLQEMYDQVSQLQEVVVEIEDVQTNFLRAREVREAFKHAITGYMKHAKGHDEIRPMTNETNDSWGGLGITLVDSLDTMCIMGLDDLFEESKGIIEERWTERFESDSIKVSFFETTIRHLGGLLAAYSCSGDRFFVKRAVQLGEKMLPAFESPTGLPYHEIDLVTGEAANAQWTQEDSILSEIGSIQLEWSALSKYSGDPRFSEASEKAMDVILGGEYETEGLYPVFFDIETGKPSKKKNLISVGGLGDSFYEYLLKMYLFTGDSKYEDAHVVSMDAVMHNLLVDSGDVTYFMNKNLISNFRDDNLFEHLQCFYPGLMALEDLTIGSSIEFEEEDGEKKRLEIAKRFLNTCLRLYNESPTGLAPDSVHFEEDGSYIPAERKYLLRPETVESLFLMTRADPENAESYREAGWKIFESIQKHCKTESAYSGVSDVNSGKKNNSMQSFFLAETLKYLYLLFSYEDLINLGDYVFTTEAHPLLIE